MDISEYSVMDTGNDYTLYNNAEFSVGDTDTSQDQLDSYKPTPTYKKYRSTSNGDLKGVLYSAAIAAALTSGIYAAYKFGQTVGENKSIRDVYEMSKLQRLINNYGYYR